MIRHITAIDNVCDNKVIDPEKVKHGIITAQKVDDLSGWIDPATHLNLEFPAHVMEAVVVAEELKKGAPIIRDNGRFLFALVEHSAYRHYGKVDVVARSARLRDAVRS